MIHKVRSYFFILTIVERSGSRVQQRFFEGVIINNQNLRPRDLYYEILKGNVLDKGILDYAVTFYHIEPNEEPKDE